MNYVISIIAPERLEILTDLCEGLGLPLTVTLHGRGTAVQSMLDLLGIESACRGTASSSPCRSKV